MKANLEQEDIQAIAQAVSEIMRPYLGAGHNEEAVFNVKGLAAYLHVSESWIYERSRLNEIPKTKPYGVLLFRRKEIDKWLEKHTTPAINTPSRMLRGELD